jgi:hypothetical protein
MGGRQYSQRKQNMNSSDQLADICPCCNRPYDLDATPAPKKASKNDFEVFWSAYPRKVGKGYCKDIWKRKTLPPIEVILASLHKAIASHDWQKEDGKYIPNPSTWINQARWEDEGIDYGILKNRIQQPTSATIDEADAFAWRAKAYPDSIERYPNASIYPFSAWPPSIQREYKQYKKQP